MPRARGKLLEKKMPVAEAIINMLQPNSYSLKSELVKKLKNSLAKRLPLSALINLRVYVNCYVAAKLVEQSKAKEIEEMPKLPVFVYPANRAQINDMLNYLDFNTEQLRQAWVDGDAKLAKEMCKRIRVTIHNVKNTMSEDLWNSM